VLKRCDSFGNQLDEIAPLLDVRRFFVKNGVLCVEQPVRYAFDIALSNARLRAERGVLYEKFICSMSVLWRLSIDERLTTPFDEDVELLQQCSPSW
jgi:hypothetical protein